MLQGGAGVELARASDSAAQSDIEEIVVTARKRTETLEAVPDAVTVLTARDLERLDLKTSSDIAAVVPGLMWQSIFGYATPNIFLRGIGNATFNANQASPVGIHEDDVYQGSSITYGFGLFDLDRVEVLKGPQGTLFGRNTTGGVINFVTRKPDVADGVNGEATGTYGSYNEADLEAAGGFALGDNNAVRLSVQRLARDGYVTNRDPASGIGHEGAVDMWSARGQWRLDLGALDILVGVHGGQNQSDVTPGKQLGVVCPPGVAVPQLGTCTDFLGFRDTTNLRENFTNIRSVDAVDSWGDNATITWAGDGYTIVSQTAFDANWRHLANDSDSGPYTEATTDSIARFHQFSEEVRALSPTGGKLTWIFGANYYVDALTAFTAFNLGALGPGSLSHFFTVPEGAASFLRQETHSYAGFGEVSYVVLPRLTATVGARWTHDQRSVDTHAFLVDVSGLASSFIDQTLADSRLLAVTIPDMDIERSWGRWSGRGVVSYALTQEILTYGQVAHGFKGGDFNGGALFGPAEANIVDPEYVTSYEAGLKGTALNRRVNFDVSGFYYDFTNQQVAILVPGSHATLQQLSNAAKTASKGLDAALQVAPVDQLLLDASANVLDSKFSRFQTDPTNPATNFAGNSTAFSPKFSFAGFARYSVQMWDRHTLSLQVDSTYKGAYFFTVDNNPALHQDGYWLENGSITLARADGRYSLSAWVKNLADRKYFETGLANSGLGFFEVIPGLPRTVGATLSAKY